MSLTWKCPLLGVFTASGAAWPKTAQLSFQVVRKNCEEFADKGLPNFPTGMPFVYWEQYIYLHGYLWLAVGIVLASTLIVLAIALMNLWAALLLVRTLILEIKSLG